ncbi:MAG: amidohydrolase family protein [Opitutaceae bacterium]|nr:amidohydrolase family protein [Opitutaceae bacterium]
MNSHDVFATAGRLGRPVSGEVLIDAHGHLGHGPDFPIIRPTAEALVASMDRLGIQFTCISSIQAIFGDAEHGNALVADALRVYPDRFFGYLVLDVGYPDKVAAQLAGGITAGFRGLKVWSYGARPGLPYNHPNYGPVFAYANEHAMPVLAHVFGPELDELEGHIKKYPRVRWLLAHIGSAELEKYMRFAREFPTVYAELCLSSCPRGLVEHLVAAGLEDKVVWGSDAVFLDQASQLGRVLFAQIPVAAKRKILGLNARCALGLAG